MTGELNVNKNEETTLDTLIEGFQLILIDATYM